MIVKMLIFFICFNSITYTAYSASSQPKRTRNQIGHIAIKKPFYRIKSKNLLFQRIINRTETFFELLINDTNKIKKITFTHTSHTLKEIKQKIATADFEKGILISFRYEKNKHQIAYHDDWVIYYNLAKMNRSECSKINTLVHETFHALDYEHGGNDPIGKENSVPYWMGNKAEELCIKNEI